MTIRVTIAVISRERFRRSVERLLIRLLARDGRRAQRRLDYRREDLTRSRAAPRVA